jgi:hypothetical protein
MNAKTIHQCECEICQNAEPDVKQGEHRRINVFMSRLDEQQRRWYAALEAEKLGHGGIELVAKITGLNVNTISRGRQELAQELNGRPNDRIRLAGGGRKALEKKRLT